MSIYKFKITDTFKCVTKAKKMFPPAEIFSTLYFSFLLIPIINTNASMVQTRITSLVAPPHLFPASIQLYRPRSTPIFPIIPIYLRNFLYYLIFSFYFLYFHVSFHPYIFFFLPIASWSAFPNFANFRRNNNTFMHRNRAFKLHHPRGKFVSIICGKK